MAELYVARAAGFGGFEKVVAIKVIHPRLAENTHFVDLLVDEAKLLVLLTHVNIAQVYDLCCIEDTYCIVMEYVEGFDLSRLTMHAAKRKRRLPPELALFIAAEMCSGLHYAHERRDALGEALHIVHRDISPQNVVISLAGEVKLVDFGIAKAALRSAQTEDGVIKGKYHYMSPEQSRGDPVDARTDVFAAGIVLHELLTGQLVYNEPNLPRLLAAVREARISPPSTIRADIEPALDAVVMKALHVDPAKRYPDAKAFEQALLAQLFERNPTFTPAGLAEFVARVAPSKSEAKHQAKEARKAWRTLVRAEREVGAVVRRPEGYVSLRPPAPAPTEAGDVRQAVRKAMLASAGSMKAATATSLLTEEGKELLARRSTRPPPAAWAPDSVRPVAAPNIASPERFEAALKQLRKRSASTASLEASVAGESGEETISELPVPGAMTLPEDSVAQVRPDRTAPTEPELPHQLPVARVLPEPAKPPVRRWPWLLLVAMLGGAGAWFAWQAGRPAVLLIDSVPSGAHVQIDGVSLPETTPLRYPLAGSLPRRIQVQVLKEGYEAWRLSLVAKNDTQTLRPSLEAQEVSVTITTEPTGGYVSVNGVPYGEAPVTVERLRVDAPLAISADLAGGGTLHRHLRVPAKAEERTIRLR